MTQVCVAVFLLVVSICLSLATTVSVDGESRLIISVAVALGTIGTDYLILARQLRKLEQERGAVYYWQRQPGIFSFDGVGVYAVPAYAVVW